MRPHLDLAGDPQCDGVALDDLVERGVDRLDQVIAGSEPVGAAQEEAVGLIERVVGVHDFRGQPARFTAEQIVSFDPVDRAARIESPATQSQGPRLDNRFVARQIAIAGMPARRDFFGVKALARFHQCRGHRLGQIESLSLRHRNRARVRAHRDCDRDADAVEAGDVAEPGDPHARHLRPHARQRLNRRCYPMGALAKGFDKRFADCFGEVHGVNQSTRL